VRVLGGDKPDPLLGARGDKALTMATARLERKRDMAKVLQQRAAVAKDSSITEARHCLTEAHALYRDSIEDAEAAAATLQAIAALQSPTLPDAVDSPIPGVDSYQALEVWLNALPASAQDAKLTLQRFAASQDHQAKSRAMFELAQMAYAQGHLDNAIELLTSAHQADPAQHRVWLPLADALVAADDLLSAQVLYQRVIDDPATQSNVRLVATSRLKELAAITTAQQDKDSPDGTEQSAAADLARVPTEQLTHDASVSSRWTIELRESHSAAAYSSDLQRALEFAEKSQWIDAIVFAERASTLEQTRHDALQILHQLYRRAGDDNSALLAIGRLISHTEDPHIRAQHWIAKADLYLELGQQDAAFRSLKEAHACHPSDATVAHRVRLRAAERGHWNLVAALLYREIAAATSPTARADLHRVLADVFANRLQDPNGARRNLAQAKVLQPELQDGANEPILAAGPQDQTHKPPFGAGLNQEPIPGTAQAELLAAEAADDFDEQMSAAGRLWQHDPGNQHAFRVLATQLRAQGNVSELMTVTKTRASRSTDMQERTMIWLNVAHLAEEGGQLEQAGSAYDQALIASPDHALALDARASLAFRVGDYVNAELIYRDLEIDQTMLSLEDIAWRRSVIAEHLGRDSEALSFAQTAAHQAPGRRDLWMRVQELASRAGAHQVALGAARSALSLVPLDDTSSPISITASIVDIMQLTGDQHGAIAQLEKLLREQPHHVASLEALASLQQQTEQWSAAARTLYQLVPLSGDANSRAQRLHQLGVILADSLHDPERADDVFLRAIDLHPTHAPTLARIIDTYWRTADFDALIDVAVELAGMDSLLGPIYTASSPTLGRALLAFAATMPSEGWAVGPHRLIVSIAQAAGDKINTDVAAALTELADSGRNTELARCSRGLVRLANSNLVDIAAIASTCVHEAVHAAIAAATQT
jgi:tetratricopeptide (TPR) repeat protein